MSSAGHIPGWLVNCTVATSAIHIGMPDCPEFAATNKAGACARIAQAHPVIGADSAKGLDIHGRSFWLARMGQLRPDEV